MHFVYCKKLEVNLELITTPVKVNGISPYKATYPALVFSVLVHVTHSVL